MPVLLRDNGAMTKLSLILFGILCCSIAGCGKDVQAVSDSSRYAQTPQITRILPPINEASGIADSRSGGTLWVIEDSGNPPHLLSLQKDGSMAKQLPLVGAENVDWEELAMLDGDLFIGDFGDNARQRPSCTIYQFTEPASDSDSITSFKTIRFRYPDRSHDAEALLVDPQTKDIFIITKSDAASMIFKLSYPYSYTEMNTVALTGTLPFNGVTGATISKTGREILLKTYLNIYSFTREASETVDNALAKKPEQVAYQVEPQGEAIAFAQDLSGFFTLSEKGMSSSVNLHFYSRK